MWLWVATEAKSKLIPVIELGPRTLDMAMGVVHALVGTMRPGCLPIFTTDGLKLYFYALTAHFGQWKKSDEMKKPVWQVAAELLYGQVKKIVRRRRLVKVEHTMLWGELENLKAGLKRIGLSGRDQHRLRRTTEFDHSAGSVIARAPHLGKSEVFT